MNVTIPSVFFMQHMDKVGSLLADHQSQIQKWKGCFGTKTQENIVANIRRGESYITYVLLTGLIKVTTGFADHEVDLRGRTCTCESWQISGLPCAHACATMLWVDVDIADYVGDYFKLKIQETIYSSTFHPLVTYDMLFV